MTPGTPVEGPLFLAQTDTGIPLPEPPPDEQDEAWRYDPTVPRPGETADQFIARLCLGEPLEQGPHESREEYVRRLLAEQASVTARLSELGAGGMAGPNGTGMLARPLEREPSAQACDPPLLERIPVGQRNSSLFSLGCSMRRRGASQAGILAALEVENRERCEPPLDDSEVAAIAASTGRYASAERIPDPAPPEGDDDSSEDEHPPEEESAEGQRSRSRSLAEVLTTPHIQEPPHAVIPALAWAGRMTLVAANEGVGKSTLFAAAAAAVTTGGQFLGEWCAQGTVLWVLLEEHVNDLVRRALTFHTTPEAFYILERPEAPLATLEAEVERLHPTVIILDTLHQFAAGAIQDAAAAEQWAPTMTALDRLVRRSNTALLMSAKAARSTGNYRDSSEIGHGVDVVLNLVRPDKGSPVRRLERQKARWALDDVTLELAGESYRLGGTIAKKLSKQRQRVLDALEPPMSYTEWHEASGVPERTFTRAVTYLVKHGDVRKTESETYELP